MNNYSFVLPYLSIIIPAFNEAKRIVPTLESITAFMATQPFSWEILVVDDGSIDDTIAILAQLNLPSLRVLTNPQNRGKGHAVRQGMLNAQGEYRLFVDADNATPIESLLPLLATVRSGDYKIAVGSRAVVGATEQKRTLGRRVLSAGSRWLIEYWLGLGIRDTQCGFKLYHASAAQHIYRLQTISGFAFDLEVLFLARKLGYRVAEVPVQWTDKPGSKVHPLRDTRRFFQDLTRIKWQDVQGRYSDVNTVYASSAV